MLMLYSHIVKLLSMGVSDDQGDGVTYFERELSEEKRRDLFFFLYLMFSSIIRQNTFSISFQSSF